MIKNNENDTLFNYILKSFYKMMVTLQELEIEKNLGIEIFIIYLVEKSQLNGQVGVLPQFCFTPVFQEKVLSCY